MDYRTDQQEPLIVIGSAGIQAFDANDGAVLWQHEWESPGFNRVATYATFVAIGNAKTLRIFERATGRACGSYELTFVVQRMLARETRLFVLGNDGLACLDGNTLLWKVEQKKGQGWLSDAGLVRRIGGLEDPLPFFAAKGGASDLALVCGEALAQTDRDV